MSVSYDEIKAQATKACEELVETAKLQKGDIFVIGCSSSEVVGLRIGKGSDINAAEAVYEGVMSVLQPRGIYLAAHHLQTWFCGINLHGTAAYRVFYTGSETQLTFFCLVQYFIFFVISKNISAHIIHQFFVHLNLILILLGNAFPNCLIQ